METFEMEHGCIGQLFVAIMQYRTQITEEEEVYLDHCLVFQILRQHSVKALSCITLRWVLTMVDCVMVRLQLEP